MNKKVDDKLKKSLMSKVKEKKTNVTTAATTLGVSERQIYNLWKIIEFANQ